MTAESWTPSCLREYVRAAWPDQGVPAVITWTLAQADAGMTIAVYECPVMDRDRERHVVLLPADHCAPPETIPFTDGKVSWPLQLRAVCRPSEHNVVPLAAASGRRSS